MIIVSGMGYKNRGGSGRIGADRGWQRDEPHPHASACVGVCKYLVASILILVASHVHASASSKDQALEKIMSAQSSADADQIVKIARQLADDISMAPRASPRVTAFVIGLFRKAETLKPETIQAEDARRIGRLYLSLSESYADVAIRYLERTANETADPEDRVALGNARMYVGDAEGARREYLAVSEKRPADPVIQVNLAMTERAMGDTAAAYRRLRQVLQSASSATVERAAVLALADIQMASRDPSAARLEVEKILRKWPNDPDAQAMMKKIQEKETRPAVKGRRGPAR